MDRDNRRVNDKREGLERGKNGSRESESRVEERTNYSLHKLIINLELRLSKSYLKPKLIF